MADGDGACVVTPGLLIADGVVANNSKFRQMAAPTVVVGSNQIGKNQLVDDDVKSLVPQVSRNLIINGNFDVWQRGGWVNLVGLPTTLGAGTGQAYGADRWCLGTPTGATHRAISRQPFDLDQIAVPHSPTYFLRWSQTTSEATPTLSQPIEDVRTAAGMDVTVTWWMKANASKNVTVKLMQTFGGGPAVQVIIAATSGGTAAITGGAAWAKFEAHFTVPTLAGNTIGGINSALVLQFIMPTGTYIIDYAQVQFEQSTVATDYETRSYLYEIARCERFFEIHSGVLWSSVANGYPCYYFATRKQRDPRPCAGRRLRRHRRHPRRPSRRGLLPERRE